MKKLLFLLFIISLQSCASILNSNYVSVDVRTTEPAKVILQQDTFSTKNNKVALTVRRQADPLLLTVQTDSITKEIEVSSKISSIVYLNFFWLYGFIADLNNPNRFTYPRSIQLDMSTDLPDYTINYLPQKGEIYFMLSIPYVNNFLVSPRINQPKYYLSSGLFGIGGSVDFYYKDDRYLKVGSAVALNSFLSSSFGQEPVATFESVYLSLSMHRKISPLSYGLGVTYGQNAWGLNDVENIDVNGDVYHSYEGGSESVFGIYSSAQLQMTDAFHIGFIYRPTFLQNSGNTIFKYEHLISLDFAWKFRLR